MVKYVLMFVLGSFFVLLIIALGTSGISGIKQKDNVIQINLSGLKSVATVDERFQSYNVEMAEVVGGNFWIPYDKMDTAHRSAAGVDQAVGNNRNLFRKMPPVDLYNKRLRMLASGLGPVYMRVSGSWANTTWFQDDDQPPVENTPEGFKNVLTRKEWKGVVDFCKAVNAKLVISFAISDGVRDKNGIWTPVQASSLAKYTRSIGGEIDAAELFNEPNFAAYAGGPKGYKSKTFAEDIKVFRDFAHKELPDMKILGPGTVGEGGALQGGMTNRLSTDSLMMADPRPVFDIFTYHFYGAVSKRCAPQGGPGSITPGKALTGEWLHRTLSAYNYYKEKRDQYLPGRAIWLTETAEAACGGDPWAATFLDCFRYVEQLGLLAKQGVRVVMHNTLNASEYGLINQDTNFPKPNYWAALLWSRLMGTEVYAMDSPVKGVDIFVHSLKDHPGGKALLMVNTLDSVSSVQLSSGAREYSLTAKSIMADSVQLNGVTLKLTADDALPEINGKETRAGTIELPAHSITFFAITDFN